ncbi:hypothetical protein, unlikely [Trypanosoma brucei gambiense DAL972]|uniref:Uncharacterized protein n=1 Tax=Trypanosoma brucei gambiense (strain MHOM/CI/86/DAL972) TaxID=679716 RepID=D0A1H0_TRYB9|nr:hypothetical protein, unlikely [Trypanosoma brucei gambiense DAL972]CBH15112.1 hypothetical protein, unlikely [Trypanosoma brucei gambiense DAL972]|eukprot:XP_011777378.1 hypothetical protein, unlikely [Trypanosoma brucei gambiense DAL972]
MSSEVPTYRGGGFPFLHFLPSNTKLIFIFKDRNVRYACISVVPQFPVAWCFFPLRNATFTVGAHDRKQFAFVMGGVLYFLEWVICVVSECQRFVCRTISGKETCLFCCVYED